MAQKPFVFECECGESVWCVSEYHRTQHLHSRHHKRALADHEREEIQNQNMVEQKAQEVLEVESLLGQRRKELEDVESRLSEAKKNLGNVEQERVALLNSAKEEAQRIRTGAKAKADSMIEESESHVAKMLKEVVALKSQAREFQRLDQYQKALLEARNGRDASESQTCTILKDLKTLYPEMKRQSEVDFMQREWRGLLQSYEVDEMYAAIQRLLAIVKREGGGHQ